MHIILFSTFVNRILIEIDQTKEIPGTLNPARIISLSRWIKYLLRRAILLKFHVITGWMKIKILATTSGVRDFFSKLRRPSPLITPFGKRCEDCTSPVWWSREESYGPQTSERLYFSQINILVVSEKIYFTSPFS